MTDFHVPDVKGAGVANRCEECGTLLNRAELKAPCVMCGTVPAWVDRAGNTWTLTMNGRLCTTDIAPLDREYVERTYGPLTRVGEES